MLAVPWKRGRFVSTTGMRGRQRQREDRTEERHYRQRGGQREKTGERGETEETKETENKRDKRDKDRHTRDRTRATEGTRARRKTGGRTDPREEKPPEGSGNRSTGNLFRPKYESITAHYRSIPGASPLIVFPMPK